MSAISATQFIHLPIATTHSGPIVTKFPATVADQNAYALSQQILARETKGAAVAEYPASLAEHENNVYIAEMPNSFSSHGRGKAVNRVRNRSLHASQVIAPGTPLAAFRGQILDQEEFETALPIQSDSAIHTLPRRCVTRDFSYGADELDLVIRDNPDMRQQDLAGLRCRMVDGSKKDGTVTVSLYGFRTSHHMLTVTPGTYICPSVRMKKIYSELPALKKGHEYLWGLATIANTDGTPYGDGRNHNAEFYVTHEPAAAVLVSKKKLKAGEEIFTSYDSKDFVVFKNPEDLWAALNVNKPIPPLRRSSKPSAESPYRKLAIASGLKRRISTRLSRSNSAT